MPVSLSARIQAYIANRKTAKLEELQKSDKEREKLTSPEQIAAFDEKSAAKKIKLEQDFDVCYWLDSAAKRAGQISMATHLIKFTHSSAKGSNILASDFESDARYLDTGSLSSMVDAGGNAAALDVASLLQLTDENGKSLLEYIKADNTEPLASFTQNKQQLETWCAGLKNALIDKTPSSHSFAKQIYFPVENDYHLLAPLYSSSLSQAIYDEIRFTRFSQEMKEIRAAKKAEMRCDHCLVAYPNLAFTVSGGSKPQNISKLNSQRGGRGYLFDTRPPTWQQKTQLPSDTNTIFTDSRLMYQTRADVKHLTIFLISVLEKDSTQAIREKTETFVERIVETLINLVAPWQAREAGWTQERDQLPLHQMRWLDPKNPRWKEDNLDWINPLAVDFGRWLKDRVEREADGKFVLSAGEADEWRQIFKYVLREVTA